MKVPNLDGFRVWLGGQGYTALTVREVVNQVRRALAVGCRRPDDVDRLFADGYTTNYRCNLRCSFRKWDDYRGAR